MLTINPLPHERLASSVKHDCAYFVSAVGGPNASPRVKLLYSTTVAPGNAQVAIGVQF